MSFEYQEPSHNYDAEAIDQALRQKLEQEKRQNGYHLGFIADGNRRWAKNQDLQAPQGHDQGAEVIEKVILPGIAQLKAVSQLSIYLLSASNMQRSQQELKNIYNLFQQKLQALITLANEQNMRFYHAGDQTTLPSAMQNNLTELADSTKQNGGLRVNLCINYSAQLEFMQALSIAAQSNHNFASLTALGMAKAVQAEFWIPSPADLVIRTGGDARFSGFLGNRPCDANCQLVVSSKFLPDVDQDELFYQIHLFSQQHRRQGL